METSAQREISPRTFWIYGIFTIISPFVIRTDENLIEYVGANSNFWEMLIFTC